MKNLNTIYRLTTISLAVSTLLIACGSSNSEATAEGSPEPLVVFNGIEAPSTDTERQAIRTSAEVSVTPVGSATATKYSIGFVPWVKSGDTIGTGTNNVFGQHVNFLGQAMSNYSEQDLTIGSNKGISSSPDHTTLLQRGNKLFSVTQFEEYAGFMYITELAQNLSNGALTATATKPVDLSGVYGGWDFCGGVPTPWGSHLGGEEYPTDVRKFEANDAAEVSGFNAYLEYWGYDPTLTDVSAKTASRAAALARTSPYRVGFPVEIKLTGDSLGSGSFAANTEATKHYAMGRIAWELAYVMPDKKTVYAGDDSTNKGMFRFVADVPGNLGSGTLYIAKLSQTNPKAITTEGGGEFNLTWINLGSASNSEIDNYIKRGIKFSDMFDYVAPAAGNATACDSGYTATYANNIYECLKLKTSNILGMSAAEIKTAASRLEALRFGAMLGGTAEFRKFEGVTFDAKRNKLYIAMSAIGSGMSSSPTLPGVSDDILVKANACGGIYQLDVDSNYITTRMTPLLMGVPKTYTDRPIQTSSSNQTIVTQQICDDAAIALPDNVTMGPTNDILIIGEDATTEHQNDFLWAYNLESKSLTRIGSVPYGAEVTSPMYYRNINGFDYMTMVVQHPYDESDYFKGPDATIGSIKSPAKANAMRAQVGYMGPFPVIKR
jgi:secreted PhoX family phosphatase